MNFALCCPGTQRLCAQTLCNMQESVIMEYLWLYRYTSFAGLFPLLSRGTLPLVKVEEISQTIDSQNFTVQNSVQFAGPLATTSVSTNAKFEVRSPQRVQVRLQPDIVT